MIIFQKLLELIKAFFSVTFGQPTLFPLFNFVTFISFFLSIILIGYWFYLEKKVPLFRTTWQNRFQTAKEAKADIQIKDVKEELKQILLKKLNPFETYQEILLLLDEVFILLGYQEGDLKAKVQQISPILLDLEKKEKLLTLLQIEKKWQKKLNQDSSFFFPQEYLTKIFQELFSIFQSLKLITVEDLRELLQALSFLQSSDHHAKSPA